MALTPGIIQVVLYVVSPYNMGMDKRTARIEARIAPLGLAMVRRAAEMEGRSVSDFMVAAALEAARKTVVEMEVIRLSRASQERFVALVSDPPAPCDALLRAIERRRELIGGVE